MDIITSVVPKCIQGEGCRFQVHTKENGNRTYTHLSPCKGWLHDESKVLQVQTHFKALDLRTHEENQKTCK